MVLFILLQLLPIPDTVLTPGVARDITLAEICSTKWGLDRRHVTTSMKQEVFRKYSIDWTRRTQYEVDHLIPRELGGSDAVENLWPEIWSDAHHKDREENRLHKAVCAGEVSLNDARSQMKNWNRPRA